MQTVDIRSRFEATGVVRLQGAFAAEQAAAMREAVWRLGYKNTFQPSVEGAGQNLQQLTDGSGVFPTLNPLNPQSSNGNWPQAVESS
jgi:hypothetical protein